MIDAIGAVDSDSAGSGVDAARLDPGSIPGVPLRRIGTCVARFARFRSENEHPSPRTLSPVSARVICLQVRIMNNVSVGAALICPGSS